MSPEMAYAIGSALIEPIVQQTVTLFRLDVRDTLPNFPAQVPEV